MELLMSAARWELIAMITAFGIVTGWRLFNPACLAGLLRSSDRTLSPGRIQLLMLTVLTALQYLLTTLHDPSRIPRLPSALVMAMGGSQLVYLSAKAWDFFGPSGMNRQQR